MPQGRVAVVGLGCLFPGAATPQAFWRNLLDERDCTSSATCDDLSVDPSALFDRTPGRTDKTYCLRGGYVREFGAQAGGREPAHWALRVARDALRDAGP
ncbi:MAG: hypothetical protein JO247_01545, partial [Chloroflexi bacterium]|nr:hypothetical protein [Chloroflexota bacterium]